MSPHLYLEYAIEKESGKCPIEGWTVVHSIIRLFYQEKDGLAYFVSRPDNIGDIGELEEIVKQYKIAYGNDLNMWFAVRSFPKKFNLIFTGRPVILDGEFDGDCGYKEYVLLVLDAGRFEHWVDD